MPDYSQYLLYTDSSLRVFKEKHAANLEKNMQIFADWIKGCRLMEWTPFVRYGATSKEIEFIVGILCCLHNEEPKRCYFSFNQGANMIRKDPETEEEFMNWFHHR